MGSSLEAPNLMGREPNIKKMERAILFKVLVIIAVLAVHIEAAGHEQNGGSRPSRPRPSRPSRPIQQPSTEMRQEVDQEHTHEEVEREQPMEASGPDHDGPDCPYKKKYKKKYGGYKKYRGGYKNEYGGYKKYDDYGFGGYKRNDDYGYGGYKQNDHYGYGGYKQYGGGYGSSYGQGYGGQKYGGGYGSYGASQYGGGYGSYGGGYEGQKYGGQHGGGYGGQQYGGYNQRYQQYGQIAHGTYGNTVNYTAPNAYVQQAPPQYNYQDVINKGYKKAGDFAQAAETYKSENVRVSFSSEHVPGEFGFLEKFHYIKPTPYGHYAGRGRQHSYYDNGSYNRGYGQRYGGGYRKRNGYGGRRRYDNYEDYDDYESEDRYGGEYEEKYYDEPKYEEKNDSYDEPEYEEYEGKYD